MPLVDLLVESELSSSRGRARTTIEQGGAYLNNRRVEDVGTNVGYDDLVAGRYVILRSGKRNYHLVSFD